MKFSTLKSKKQKIAVVLICLTNIVRAQKDNYTLKDSVLRKSNNSVGIELSASMLPQAHIQKFEGSYDLRSNLQSSYDLGVLYIYQLNSGLKIISGLHVIVGKRNYYAFVPAADFPTSMNITNDLYIEDKFTWSQFRVPFLFEKCLFGRLNKRAIDLAFGFDLSFAFKSTFEGEVHNVMGSNNQSIRVLETTIESTNDGKPWINYLFGISKVIDKKRHFSLGLDANVSSTFFVKGSYLFTIPGKPNASGSYRISGTGISLRIRYLK